MELVGSIVSEDESIDVCPCRAFIHMVWVMLEQGRHHRSVRSDLSGTVT